MPLPSPPLFLFPFFPSPRRLPHLLPPVALTRRRTPTRLPLLPVLAARRRCQRKTRKPKEERGWMMQRRKRKRGRRKRKRRRITLRRTQRHANGIRKGEEPIYWMQEGEEGEEEEAEEEEEVERQVQACCGRS